jgi:5-methylcytosine-specific restriction endonuclease McrA
MHERRRARALGAGPSFTAAEWTALVGAYGNRCAYDGAPGPLHADHRLPLARGGTNEIQNILPACARCNLRKHLMTEEEFRARLAAERDAP